MFGLGFLEIAVILLVLVIFVKPEDLPKLVRKAGQFYARAEIMYQRLVHQLREADHTVKSEVKSLQNIDISTQKKRKNSKNSPREIAENPSKTISGAPRKKNIQHSKKVSQKKDKFISRSASLSPAKAKISQPFSTALPPSPRTGKGTSTSKKSKISRSGKGKPARLK